MQQRVSAQRVKKYGFLIHTEHGTEAHAWQLAVVEALLEQVEEKARNGTDVVLRDLVRLSYDSLLPSLACVPDLTMPPFDDVVESCREAFLGGFVGVSLVNSDVDVEALLDDRGQLKLTYPMNVFIGGQILDRGITIDNLVGFYYGRSPNKFQQDTVLQHCRMYGNRPEADLAITRLYTSRNIYEAMRRINEFDSALRSDIEHGEGVYFIRIDDNRQIVPCSPNKILQSTTTTIRPFKRLLPIGFQTKSKSRVLATLGDLDSRIMSLQGKSGDAPFLVELNDAKQILAMINGNLDFDENWEWDVNAFNGCMEHLSLNSIDAGLRGKVWCLVRRGRKVSRRKQDGSFFDAPDTSQTEGVIARAQAIDIPMLMLFRQDGEAAQGWRDCPFWWPVLFAPKNTKPVVFASDVV